MTLVRSFITQRSTGLPTSSTVARREREVLAAHGELSFVHERIARRTLVDDWPDTGVGPHERKTRLYVRDVERVRLVRDERGWLRLAG
jgi:hypothetical protein